MQIMLTSLKFKKNTDDAIQITTNLSIVSHYCVNEMCPNSKKCSIKRGLKKALQKHLSNIESR